MCRVARFKPGANCEPSVTREHIGERQPNVDDSRAQPNSEAGEIEKWPKSEPRCQNLAQPPLTRVGRARRAADRDKKALQQAAKSRGGRREVERLTSPANEPREHTGCNNRKQNYGRTAATRSAVSTMSAACSAGAQPAAIGRHVRIASIGDTRRRTLVVSLNVWCEAAA